MHTFEQDVSDETGNLTMRELGFEVPKWIAHNITLYDVDGVRHGGCASGAYMPAVTYKTALATMSVFGDEILNYLFDHCYDNVQLDLENETWAMFASKVVTLAVEEWCEQIDYEHQFELEDEYGELV